MLPQDFGSMMIKLVFIFWLSCLLYISVLGQVLKFEEAVRLPSPINTEVEESMPIISADGQTMFFVRSFYNKNKG